MKSCSSPETRRRRRVRVAALPSREAPAQTGSRKKMRWMADVFVKQRPEQGRRHFGPGAGPNAPPRERLVEWREFKPPLAAWFIAGAARRFLLTPGSEATMTVYLLVSFKTCPLGSARRSKARERRSIAASRQHRPTTGPTGSSPSRRTARYGSCGRRPRVASSIERHR